VKLRLFRYIAFIAIALALGMFRAGLNSQTATQAPPQTPPQSRPASQAGNTPPAAIQQKVEAYLRHLYAWGPSYKLSFGPLKDTPIANIYQVTVEVSTEGQTDSATFYVTKDGRYMMRSELEDLNSDPVAEMRKQITLTGFPSKGPTNARVVLVEFADYECPSCKQLDTILRSMLPKFPDVRLVFKDFPLTQIHPWAATAANAGRCAYKQNPTAYWKFHDLVFDNQETISPENAWQRLQEYAADAGLDPAGLRTCMADPQTLAEVQKSVAEGEALHIANTPTVFVNGRRLIGPDAAALEQLIHYEQGPAGGLARPSSK
jgi:protein-disulfide isomerase